MTRAGPVPSRRTVQGTSPCTATVTASITVVTRPAVARPEPPCTAQLGRDAKVRKKL
ncbi:MAG: hypothetical protein JWP68_2921, partial [Modestobacter sp.]|nr:hypothetical protein [Modestobacter sp.]